jgi:flavin reductase (DIM6/NTAB) family NADH-FMN oxidoreductase RutF
MSPNRPTYSDAPDQFERRAFRRALGHFPTGVTIITARAANGDAVGLTVTSFNSVSLRPPLILWSLGVRSPNLPRFRECRHYAVNVLAEGQAELAHRFGSSQAAKFDGATWREGLGGAPVLEGCAAHFECRNEFCHPGGDHVIFVGQVERFESFNRASLLFARSAYHRVGEAAEDGGFSRI